MHPHCLLLLCVMGLSSLPVSGQEEPASNGRELRLLALSPIDLPLSLGSKENDSTLILRTEQFTLIKGKQLPGGKTVEIFAEVPDLKGQPKSQPAQPAPFNPDVPQPLPPNLTQGIGPTKKILYATGSWPAGAQDAIGFLAPDGNAAIPEGKLVLLPDSPDLHPEHSMRAINLTDIPLGIRLGEIRAVVPVWGDLISAFDPGRLRIDIAVDENEKWHFVTGSNLTTARHYRCFVLIRPQVNPNPLFPSDQPDIMGIFEQTSPLPIHAPLPPPKP